MIPYVETETYLYRFLSHHSPYFWPTIEGVLTEHSLFLNSRIKFNDPFDSQPAIKDDLPSSTIRRYAEQMIQTPFSPARDATTSAAILRLRSQGKTHLNKAQIERIKADSRKIASEYLDACGLLSFSLTAENPLLWGHYAASFSGVCLVFRRGSSMQSALCVCAKVIYVEKRPQLPLSLLFEFGTSRIAGEPIDDLANRTYFLSFLHKDSHWSYEQEARVFYPFRALSNIQFDQSELLAVILGPRSPDDLIKRLSVEVKERYPAISIHQASLSRTEFKIVIPHSYRQRAQLG